MRLRFGGAFAALLAFSCLAPALRADADEVKKPEAKDELLSPPLKLQYGILSDVGEVEPNDHPAQANLLGCGNTFRPAEITAGAVRDTDWITFTASAGEVITFGTDADGPSPIGDTRISILSSDGVTVLGTDDDGGPGRYSLLSLCAPYTGTYYGRIAAFGSQTGTYMAFLTCTASSAPNDQCAGAIRIPCGPIALSGSTADACPDYSPGEGGCTGFAANGRDVVYRVDAFAGDSLYLDYVQDTADGSIYIVTDCSDPAGSCVAGEDSTLTGGHETLSYKFPTTGTYYVILDSFSPGSGGTWTASGVLLCAPDRTDSLATVHTDLDLVGPWGTETVALNGSATLLSTIHALQVDFSGAEAVPAELTQLELTGTSLTVGPVTVRLRSATLPPFERSTGLIEEITNSTPGVLDLPPYAPVGSAYFQLHAFLEVEIPALKLVLHGSQATNLFGTIHAMPSGVGESIVYFFTTFLLDPNGALTAYQLYNVRTTLIPAAAVDTLTNSRMTLDLQGPLGLDTVILKGRTTAQVGTGNVGDRDGNGLEEVPAAIPDLSLSGVSQRYGAVHLFITGPGPSLLPPSTGQVEENLNTQTARLDLPPFAGSGTAASDLDLFFDLAIGGTVYHNQTAKHLVGTLTQLPPAAGEQYRNFVATPLLDASNQASPYQARRMFFMPVDVPMDSTERDSFPASRLAMDVSGPWGIDELILTGKTNVEWHPVSLADSAGLETMSMGITRMSLSSPGGVFSHIPGPVTVQLSDTIGVPGAIQEAVNYTPGLLDLPPFTPVGSGNGSFPSFQLTVNIPGQPALHLQQPADLSATVHRVPAGPGDTYGESGAIPLVDAGQSPSGMSVTGLRLTLVGGTVSVSGPPALPTAFAIQEIRPNPSSGNATITLALPRRGGARLAAYDVNGRLVRTLWDGEMDAGIRTIAWDGRTDRGDPAPGGIYFLRFESANQRSVKRLAILR